MYIEVVKGTVGNLPIRVGEGCARKTGKICDMHCHDEAEVLWVNRGQITCMVLDKPLVLRKGDLVFLNSLTPHATSIDAPQTMSTLLQFHIGSLSPDASFYRHKYLSLFLNNRSGAYFHVKAGTPLSAPLTRCMQDMVRESQRREKGFELYVKSHVLLMLGLLHRNHILESGRGYDQDALRRVLPAILHIDTHYNTPLSLEEISGRISVTPHYFCRLFKKATGSTFVNYINFVRVLEAEKLLLNRDSSVTQIASRVGFSDAAYFNRVFRRLKNRTPTEYLRGAV